MFMDATASQMRARALPRYKACKDLLMFFTAIFVYNYKKANPVCVTTKLRRQCIIFLLSQQ